MMLADVMVVVGARARVPMLKGCCPVTAGATLKIVVGGHGGSSSNICGDGGFGGSGASGGGGGGRSAIQFQDDDAVTAGGEGG